MVFSINVDWSTQYEEFENIGRCILRDSCNHKEGVEENDWCDKCDIHEDSAEPMMNYIYPLVTTPDDEKILKVVKETNCTVVEKDGEYFLTLCGGGMNLSQDIAYSYLLLERWIPRDLIVEVAKQPCLSVGSKNWKRLARAVISQLKTYARQDYVRAREWKETYANYRNKKAEE